MEILPILKNEGAVYDLTTTPVVIDLAQFAGGYVRLSSPVAADAAYVVGLPSITPPTVFIATTTGETGHETGTVTHVAEPIALGLTGTHRIVEKANRFLWIRTIAGTATLHIKPAGRPGEWGN